MKPRLSTELGKGITENTIKEKSKLIVLISKILKIKDTPPKKSVFKFGNTTQASDHNAKIFKIFKYDY